MHSTLVLTNVSGYLTTKVTEKVHTASQFGKFRLFIHTFSSLESPLHRSIYFAKNTI